MSARVSAFPEVTELGPQCPLHRALSLQVLLSVGQGGAWGWAGGDGSVWEGNACIHPLFCAGAFQLIFQDKPGKG